LKPRLWVSWRPFGVGLERPNNYFEVLRAAVGARRHPKYAWEILNKGVCDGCALGTAGMKDWTVKGTHLCNVRLRLLDLNLADAMDHSVLADAGVLTSKTNADLRALGRLAHPMLRTAGQPGFTKISWAEANNLIADRIKSTTPDRVGAYLTSRGMPNESYYGVQKAIRAMGCMNIDNASRLCHAPSAHALKNTLGVTSTTCSYSDLFASDLIVFVGSNPANNQPVMMKYLLQAKRNGARVVGINPLKEPGMERYWIPSDPESALFGTKITDRWFQVGTGGDIAFLTGTFKALSENDWIDRDFVSGHTNGFEDAKAYVEASDWALLEQGSGLSRAEMFAFAQEIHNANKAVFVWSMGATQHARGEDIVRMIINLALTGGFVGREGSGLMPIRGHSGVQGGAEMGCYSTVFPGFTEINSESAAKLGDLWGFEVPSTQGQTAPEMLDSALVGKLDVMLSVGGNFLDVLPDPEQVERALGAIPLRVHMDIVVNRQMMLEPNEAVLLLPATTRYEVAGGVTETSTERRVILSPEIPGGPGRIPEARSEWQVFGELAAAVRPDIAARVCFNNPQAIRDEIAAVVPGYEQVSGLTNGGDSFQIGGEHLCAGWQFPTSDGRARFQTVSVPAGPAEDGLLTLSTRRGKQFNSMIQSDHDALTGVDRDAILISAGDAGRRELVDGDAVTVRSSFGSLSARIVISEIAEGSVQVLWPEGNVLIAPDVRSDEARIPDYNARVEVTPVR